MKYKHTKEAAFDKFYEAVSPYLNKVGRIRTGDIWHALQNQYSYSYLVPNFKLIMDTMVEQGKAYKITNGHWQISKPNDPKYNASDNNNPLEHGAYPLKVKDN